MSKYYAVAKGRQVGVYRSWVGCQSQVNGYKGASFKSFNTQKEAEDFCGIFPALLPMPKVRSTTPAVTSLPSTPPSRQPVKICKLPIIVTPPSNQIDIYTDGSHIKGGANPGHIGSGAYCCWKGKEYRLCRPCTPEVLVKYGIDSNEVVSNPTAEFLAFAEVLCMFQHRDIPPNYTICFHIDYVGVRAWMVGDWQAKKSYIAAIRDTCHNYMTNIPNKVVIEYVASKSDAGNLEADALAKSSNPVDTFGELLRALESE
jgi:hypothetical protein